MTTTSGFPVLLAMLLVPLTGAGVVVLLKRDARKAKLAALAVSLLEFGLAVAAWLHYRPSGARIQLSGSVDWIPAFGVRLSFGVDGIALIMIALLALLTPIVIGASWTDRLPDGRSAAGFYALLLTMESLVMGVSAATDVFVFYVLFELMLIPMYFLIGFYGGPRRRRAATKFFLYSFFGGLIMLASAIGLWAYPGTFDWQTLSTVVSRAPRGTQVWLFLGFLVAFAIKAPLVPFHTWLPDAAEQAPIGVSVILIAVLDKVGIFGFLRYTLPLLPDASRTLAPLLLVLSVIGILYGAMLAAGQSDMRRFMAYVSVAHFGFMGLGVFAFTTQAQVGAVSYVLNHGLATALMLLVMGMIMARGSSARAEDYGGMAARTPLLAGMMLLAGLTTLSLPGTNTFVSEFLVLVGAYPARPVYAILGTIGMILAAVYVLWLYQRIMHGPARGTALAEGPGAAFNPAAEIRVVTWRERLVLAPLAALVVALGLFPQPLLDVVGPSVSATLHALGR